MKPSRILISLLCATPVAAPLAAAIANDQVRTETTEALLAPFLEDPQESPAAANPAPSSPARGWIPSAGRLTEELPAIASLDADSGRSGGPHGAAAVAGEAGVVRFGDTLLKIAQRYGLTLAELLRLNPGMETARLVVGSQVRVAQSAPGRSRMVLGLAPVGSGGISWPELPRFGEEQNNRPSGNNFGGRDWIWPAKGVFTSGYGWRWGRMHKGIDVANDVGTPIVAAQRGRVLFSGWDDGGYGYLVKIAHDDGTVSVYGHNSSLLVRTGESVEQGQLISRMGSTGRSTGPHLHFEIRPAGEGAVNPLRFLPPRA